MTQKTADGIRTEMEYNAANRLTSLTSQNGTVEYSYDANGNLILSHMDDKVNTYSYDATGRLKWYTGHDGYEERYTYDAAGNSVKKETRGKSERKTLEELAQMNNQLNRGAVEEEAGAGEAGGSAQWTQTEYVNDVTRENAEVLMERTGAKTTYYEYGLERISSQEKEWFAERKTEYVYDGRGSVAQEYSYNNAWYNYWFPFTQGREVESKRYTPYGESITAKGTGYGYNGEYYSAQTGQQYLRMRYYDPSMMRFSQKDIVHGEIGDAQNVNRYAYVKNDPVGNIDPSGMWSAKAAVDIVTKTMAQIAAAAGMPISVVQQIATGQTSGKSGKNSSRSGKGVLGYSQDRQELYDYVKGKFPGYTTGMSDGVPSVYIENRWVPIISKGMADLTATCVEMKGITITSKTTDVNFDKTATIGSVDIHVKTSTVVSSIVGTRGEGSTLDIYTNHISKKSTNGTGAIESETKSGVKITQDYGGGLSGYVDINNKDKSAGAGSEYSKVKHNLTTGENGIGMSIKNGDTSYNLDIDFKDNSSKIAKQMFPEFSPEYQNALSTGMLIGSIIIIAGTMIFVAA